MERRTRQGKISYVTAWVISAKAQPLPASWSLLFQRRYKASSLALEQSSEVSRNRIPGPWTEVLLIRLLAPCPLFERWAGSNPSNAMSSTTCAATHRRWPKWELGVRTELAKVEGVPLLLLTTSSFHKIRYRHCLEEILESEADQDQSCGSTFS